MNRRSFLKSILAAGVAPYVVTAAGVLMPVRTLWPPYGIVAGMRAVQIEANAAASMTLSMMASFDGLRWFDVRPDTAVPDDVRCVLSRALVDGAGLLRIGYDLADYGRAGGASFAPASS
jgi:hypothetical protein